MVLPLSCFLLAILPGLALCAPSDQRFETRGNVNTSAVPTATLSQGTYYGVRNSYYAQDFFLGIPYAQPPTGSLRFAAPQPLTTSFSGRRNATEYGPMCIGYGSDTTNLGNYVSEDCLTINVVRPAGTSEKDELPVAVWIHGGSYVMGGSRDPRYNLTFIVEQSVKEGKPMIAASINYRLSYWGFLFSSELKEAGAGNIAFRDQRLALQWVHDNIAAFGGSPDKVTIWGESAGARSVGMQLVAYDGNNDGLFRSAILESGSPVAKFAGADAWQPYFNALVEKTGCANTTDCLGCLRELPWSTLNAIFNSTTALGVTSPTLSAVIDDDFMTAQGYNLLREGNFAQVSLLVGNNFDEGTAYAKQGINTTAEFLNYVVSQGLDASSAATVGLLYPDDPSVGIPASYPGRPPAYPYGSQFKRVAAFAGDVQQHCGRRHTANSYVGSSLPVYSYMWNVHVNGVAEIYGATHFQEVAFVFNNVQGLGYSVNPFAGKPETFKELADMMSKMWVSFIHHGNPNLKNTSLQGPAWPQYTLNNPHNLVFDVNVTNLSYIDTDDYRNSGIAYLLENLFS
ncbi:Alpha/Beta hydrolase protein [Biscogniauxia mediterranea]|nr:Alpha/Beta hydrolase protein [Biscogniauxia mediterranea]